MPLSNLDSLPNGAPVEIDVPCAGDGVRITGQLEGVSETHAAVRLANRMLVSVERALVKPREMEDAA